MSAALIEHALAAHAAGLAVLPPRLDGSKRPVGDGWERWQRERPSVDLIRRWYRPEAANTGLGTVCGQVAGNLELFEFDERRAYDDFLTTAEAVGLAHLVERVQAGYLEASPSGGIHWLYRCEEITGNTVLAKRPKRPDERRHPNDDWQVQVETRGEGGYAVLAPSHGPIHPSGKPYLLLRGGVATIPVISPDERRALWDLARTFDLTPGAIATQTRSGRQGDSGLISDVNARMAWPEILEPRGWTRVFSRGGVTYWRRPGKDGAWSAISGYDARDLFCNYSTSTGLAIKKGYSKFGLFAELQHGGDFSAAAAELGRRGYGAQLAPRSTPIADLHDDAPPFPLETLPTVLRDLVVEGAAALVAPPDFVAVPLLVAAGAAIGDALELVLKSGWSEGANLYAACVGDPGSKKSPSFRVAMQPLYRLQARLRQEYRNELEAHKQDLAAWEGERKAGRGPRPEPPTFSHVVTTDATTEALAPMLLSSKGLLLLKDELTGWVRGMDQYRSGGKGADRQHYLSMWSRGLIKVDRKSSPEPIIVPRPCLSTLGGIQPELLPDLADAAQREDGFLDRLLWSYPDALPDRWTMDGIGVETLRAAEVAFERIHRLESERDDEDEPMPRAIRLSSDALELWAAWYAELAAEMTAEHFARRLRGPWAKLPAQLARLTLILHALATSPIEDEVRPETLGAAADLLDYFKAHALRVYRQLAHRRRDRVMALLGALKARGPMTQRAILHDVFKRNASAKWLRATLEDLEEAGLVMRDVRQGVTGRPATIWSAM